MGYESFNQTEIEIIPEFTAFMPEDFRTDPFGYFERNGKNIKSGEIQHDAEGVVKEDPTATKDLPPWLNEETGEVINLVGKKVNVSKAETGKSGDPFYEYSIMVIAKEFDLPVPTPIGKIKSGDEHLILMEKVEGIRWTEEGMRSVNEAGLTESEKQVLISQATTFMEDLQKRFEEIGLIRKWKLKDMVFNVDLPNKKVLSVVPTDWERTKIDQEKLDLARQKKSV